MARIPIALQLYSVREDCARDLAGTVKAVAEMGYEGVEFAGYYDWSAADLRKLLDDCGLVCVGTHIGLDALLGEAFDATVEFHKTLGCHRLIVPGLAPERCDSKDHWLETAQLFNELADKLRPLGLQVGYHNHTHEFQLFDGETGWDLFFGNTSADVIMQFDTGNAMHGGANPIPYLERYPGRAKSVHLKEFSATNDKALIGEGDIPWSDVFRLCETTAGTEVYVVEQESYAYPPLECVKRCLDNLRAMGK